MANSIEFVKYNDVGAEVASQTVTGFVLYETDHDSEIWSQTSVVALSGLKKVYSGSVERINAVIAMKALSKTDGSALESFIRNDLVYQEGILGVKVGGQQIDLGLGFGVDILFANKASFAKTTLKGLLKYRPPNRYDLVFNFDYIKA